VPLLIPSLSVIARTMFCPCGSRDAPGGAIANRPARRSNHETPRSVDRCGPVRMMRATATGRADPASPLGAAKDLDAYRWPAGRAQAVVQPGDGRAGIDCDPFSRQTEP
jgi:hypothetical protein